MSDIKIYQVLPCAEDEGRTKTLYGSMHGLEFPHLAEARGTWSPILFRPSACAVYRRGNSILIVQVNGHFSFTRLASEKIGMSLLNDLVQAYRA